MAKVQQVQKVSVQAATFPMFVECEKGHEQATADAVATAFKGFIKSSVGGTMFTLLIPTPVKVEAGMCKGKSAVDAEAIRETTLETARQFQKATTKEHAKEIVANWAKECGNPLQPWSDGEIRYFGSISNGEWKNLRDGCSSRAKEHGGIVLFPINPSIAEIYKSRTKKVKKY